MYKVLKITCAVIVLLIRPFVPHVLVTVAIVVYMKNKNKNIQESFAKITAISETDCLACNTNAKICRCCSFDDPINTVHRLRFIFIYLFICLENLQ